MRPRSIEETKTGREMIIVEEIPYQVNNADMVRKTAELVNDKKIEGISEIRERATGTACASCTN